LLLQENLKNDTMAIKLKTTFYISSKIACALLITNLQYMARLKMAAVKYTVV